VIHFADRAIKQGRGHRWKRKSPCRKNGWFGFSSLGLSTRPLKVIRDRNSVTLAVKIDLVNPFLLDARASAHLVAATRPYILWPQTRPVS
jgi:hypothetical protein